MGRAVFFCRNDSANGIFRHVGFRGTRQQQNSNKPAILMTSQIAAAQVAR